MTGLLSLPLCIVLGIVLILVSPWMIVWHLFLARMRGSGRFREREGVPAEWPPYQ